MTRDGRREARDARIDSGGWEGGGQRAEGGIGGDPRRLFGPARLAYGEVRLGDRGLAGGQLAVDERRAQLAGGGAGERRQSGQGVVEPAEGRQLRRAALARGEVLLGVPRCGKVKLSVCQGRQELWVDVIRLPHSFLGRTRQVSCRGGLCPLPDPRYSGMYRSLKAIRARAIRLRTAVMETPWMSAIS